MTALRTLTALCFSMCLQFVGSVQAQPVSELPRAEYYVARELFRVGRTLEAAEGFKAALTRSRRIGEQRWIDSIPPLVMLGECYYQQGNLALSLEQYDSALMLALANPGWINQIEIQVEQLTELEPSTKGINWFTKSRPTRTVYVPPGNQIAIDPTQAQVTPQGGVVAPVSLITQLDVTELLRTMGVALMRRWEALGPMAKHSPLADPLDALFAQPPKQQVPWVLSSWRILQGLSSLSSPVAGDARQLLRDGTLIGNQSDYYLSSLALLVLGKLDARDRNHQAAMVNFQDAALLAAYFDQWDTVSEALDHLSASASAVQRIELMEPLQRVASWANKKSSSVQVAALLGSAELSIYANESALADKSLKQAAVLLRGREVSLPRMQAHLSFLNAMHAFGQNRSTAGISSLDTALKMMRGTAASGAVLESVFQAQMTLDLLASKAITANDAEAILQDAIAEPSPTDWELHPLKTLAEITTARGPAYVRMLELAIARNAESAVLLERLDQIQRQRIYESLPLGGRLLALRTGTKSNPAELQPVERLDVESLHQRAPMLVAQLARINALVDQLRQAAMPLDERKLTAEAKKSYAELEELAANYESQLAFQSLQRRMFSRLAPPRFDLLKTQQLMSDSDLLLGLVSGSQQVFGVALTKDQVRFWTVGDSSRIQSQLAALLSTIGLVRDGKPSSPAEVTSATAAWKNHAAQLSATLFPAEVQKLVENCGRVIIAPHDHLWYVPYELLPLGGLANNGPWIVHHAVTYVPNLGSISYAFTSAPVVKDSVGIVSDFFAIDPESNQSQSQQIVQSVPNTYDIPLAQKVTVPSAAWLKLRTDQLWIAGIVDSTNGWETPVLPFGKTHQARLGSWLETPCTSPARVLLPGLQPGIGQGKMSNGNELLLPVCSLLFSGTKSAIISRWPVGGRSTSTLLQRQLEEMQFERPSNAHRRAILAQWPEQFLIAEEPALLPAGKEASALTSGFHPLFWGGYMVVGDYSSPN